MNWQEFEDKVRSISEYLWSAPAKAETVCEIRFDCVVKKKKDYWILVEISKDNSLPKLRTDIAKFNACRLSLMSRGIYPECHFVCDAKAHPSVYKTGDENNVSVHHYSDFEKIFFNSSEYTHLREGKIFGSAVDLSGIKDSQEYIPVTFLDSKGEEFNSSKIAERLIQNNRIILLGEFGTGKSRCVQELFNYLANSNDTTTIRYPLSIDLKENWGVKRSQEIVRRHFEDLGMSESADNVLRILDKYALCFLLDGFDEVGAQTLSNNPDDLKQMKMNSLAGVRDLIKNSKGGLFITGREHFFNNSKEMFECLGLDQKNTLLLYSPAEFSLKETVQYLGDERWEQDFPSWLPRRPLICQLLKEFDPDEIESISTPDGESSFWDRFFDIVCQREARINTALDSDTIRGVFIALCRTLRKKASFSAPISPSEIAKAFEIVANRSASNESLIMLQRSFILGRVDSESSDRKFIDRYIVDGLFAEDIEKIVNTNNTKVFSSAWNIPMGERSTNILSGKIEGNIGGYVTTMREAAKNGNVILATDIMISIAKHDHHFDFKNIYIEKSHIEFFDLRDSNIKNLRLSEVIIDKLDITNSDISNVVLDNCMINQIVGVTGREAVPEWINEPMIESYQQFNTKADLKAINLSDNHLIFLDIVHKLFFQPGKGRKLSALLKGPGSYGKVRRRIVEKILSILLRGGFVTRHPGDNEDIYKPVRKYSPRFEMLEKELTTSTDELWQQVGEI